MDSAQRVSLTEAISAVRSELAEAVTQASDERLNFGVGSVELEFEIELLAEAAGKAGVRVWVVSGGAGGAAQQGVTHRLRVSLNPVDASGSAPLISDEDEVRGIEEWDR